MKDYELLFKTLKEINVPCHLEEVKFINEYAIFSIRGSETDEYGESKWLEFLVFEKESGKYVTDFKGE